MWFNKAPVRHERVEEGLNNLVYALKETIPSLKQVRVFGSYNNGNWDPERSDVDVFVRVGDERYSYLKHGKFNENLVFRESEDRKMLRQRIMDHFFGDTLEFKERFHPHILSENDLKEMWNLDKGKGPIGKNMSKGRLLYSSRFCDFFRNFFWARYEKAF